MSDPVRQSYGRCLMAPGFFERFYAIFFGADPRVSAHFLDTRLASQRTALRDGITQLLMFGAGVHSARRTANRLGRSHNKHNLDIEPELYGVWLDSLVAAVAECDPSYTDELGSSWRRALQPGIDHMIAMHSGDAIPVGRRAASETPQPR